jgi:hypothetical protein
MSLTKLAMTCLGVVVLSAGGAPMSTALAMTLLGDVISGSYDYPCDACTDSHSYSNNPFVVDGTVETLLKVGATGTTNWDVNFNANTLVLTFVGTSGYVGSSVFYSPAPFNGPEFTILSGNSFASVIGVQADLHCAPCNPVQAYVSGETLFVNWEGAGGDVGDTIEVDFSVGGPVGVPAPIMAAGLPGTITVLVGGALLGWSRRRTKEARLSRQPVVGLTAPYGNVPELPRQWKEGCLFLVGATPLTIFGS